MRWIVVGVAAYRVARMLTAEHGPGGVFERLRGRAGVYEPGPQTELSLLMSCPFCLSVWLAAGFAVLDRFAPAIVDAIASAGVASAILDTTGTGDDV